MRGRFIAGTRSDKWGFLLMGTLYERNHGLSGWTACQESTSRLKSDLNARRIPYHKWPIVPAVTQFDDRSLLSYSLAVTSSCRPVIARL